MLACRTVSKGEALKKELCSSSSIAAGQVSVEQLDLASLQSVRAFAARWGDRPLHVLVNNAGIYAMGAPRAETQDGFEEHMGANHLGHFLLTLLLLPALRKGAASPGGPGEARIVNVSSALHAQAVHGISPADPFLAKPGAFSSERAYTQSKLAQILFTREARRRLAEAGGPAVHLFAVHPGNVCTDVVRSLHPAVQYLYRLVLSSVLLTPSQGARASVFCATSRDAPAAAEATCGYFSSNCIAVQPSRRARDETAARWLWDWSCETVKVPAAARLPDGPQ